MTKELGTFLSWGKEEIIGYGTFEQQGKQYVNKIWCKIWYIQPIEDLFYLKSGIYCIIWSLFFLIAGSKKNNN